MGRQVRGGHPAEVLLNESAGADLLVVGHRCHGTSRGLLVGSVAVQCVTHAGVPVVVVRSPAQE